MPPERLVSRAKHCNIKRSRTAKVQAQIWTKRFESHNLMYVQKYTKKELFINFFSLQPLQAILFLQYLLFQRKVKLMGEKKSSHDQHKHIHQKQTSSQDENTVLAENKGIPCVLTGCTWFFSLWVLFNSRCLVAIATVIAYGIYA